MELQDRPDLTKTTLCTEWRKGRCPLTSAECKFAHGPWDLRSPTAAMDASGARGRRRRATKTGMPGTPTKSVTSGTPKSMSRQVSAVSASVDAEEEMAVTPHGKFNFDKLHKQRGDTVGLPKKAPLAEDTDGVPWTAPTAFDGDMFSDNGSMSRQVTNASEDNDSVLRQKASTLWNRYKNASVPSQETVCTLSEGGGWSRQATEEDGEGVFQMPVMIDVGAMKLPALAVINIGPDMISETKGVIEKALRDAMPDHYED
jgi:hypothetical protein